MGTALTSNQQANGANFLEIDFARSLNLIQEIVYVFDVKNDVFAYVNQAYEHIWGRPQADLLQAAHSFWEGIHPDDLLLRQKAVEQSQQQAGVTQFEYRVIQPNGSVRWVSNIIYSDIDESGQVYRQTGIVVDITQQKLLENSLHQMAIHMQALQSVEAELQQANQFKDEFLANMSHELRTPLTGVLTKAELLHEGVYGPLTDAQMRELHVIKTNGQHLLAQLNDIFDFSQLAAGQLDLMWEPISVRDVCAVSLQAVREAAAKKDIQLIAPEIDPAILMDGDRQYLKKILMILLSNAVKFTSAGGEVGLQVSVLAAAAGDQIVFVVWDTGIGFSSQKTDQIFIPFKQLDGGLARQYDGLGLGLTLCQQLVHLHGGWGEVESQPDQGSQFTIYIPRQRSDKNNKRLPLT